MDFFEIRFHPMGERKKLENKIKTMLCGHFIGIDKLEPLKLLQNDQLVTEFNISVKEPETVSRFLGNFTL